MCGKRGCVKDVIMDEACKVIEIAALVNYSVGGVIFGCYLFF